MALSLPKTSSGMTECDSCVKSALSRKFGIASTISSVKPCSLAEGYVTPLQRVHVLWTATMCRIISESFQLMPYSSVATCA